MSLTRKSYLNEALEAQRERLNPDSEESSISSRGKWSSGMEFLLSCIAMSVGLGNIWRFPFTAFANGGGAFLIPYFIVLLIIGRPSYFLEMIMGQFSSRGNVKVYNCAPAMRGIGVGQIICLFIVSTYYSSIMAITLHYLFKSFFSNLPWATCNPAWNVSCQDSVPSKIAEVLSNETIIGNATVGSKTSSEWYFEIEVLKGMKSSIEDGLGTPNIELIACLVVSWTIVYLILMKGIKTSGKASYITAIFPYIVLLILLVKSLTLPGAAEGLKRLFVPQWEKLLSPKVWYQAATQCFFSLNIFFAPVIMYSSYNHFNHNIHRDSNIVNFMDTFTSMLSGCITFAVVGNIANQRHIDWSDEGQVASVAAGPSLAFITYPHVIANFDTLPQLFSILFFVMLYVLGIGSNLAMTSSVVAVITDKFESVKQWQASLVYVICGVICGSFYTTPGGMTFLGLMDHYGANFVVFILAIFELITFSHIYGVDRICKDVNFMLGFTPGVTWRVCWKYLTPGLMIAVMGYYLYDYRVKDYPDWATYLGWGVSTFCLLPLPTYIIYKVAKRKEETFVERVKEAFSPNVEWGPADLEIKELYIQSRKASAFDLDAN